MGPHNMTIEVCQQTLFRGGLRTCDLVRCPRSRQRKGIGTVLQVGKDQEAQAFLGKLDNDPVIGREVDATSYFELEAMEYQRKGVVSASFA